VFHGDAHMSEYLAPGDERIGYISGFTGSNGLCVVTQKNEDEGDALMWTDGRYYLQAEKQLYEGWKMMKMEAKLPQYTEWIKQNVKPGSKIGVDEFQMAVGSFQTA